MTVEHAGDNLHVNSWDSGFGSGFFGGGLGGGRGDGGFMGAGKASQAKSRLVREEESCHFILLILYRTVLSVPPAFLGQGSWSTVVLVLRAKMLYVCCVPFLQN